MMKKLVQYKKNKKGFTLVELIVVIAIIAILAAVLLPKYFGFTDNARQSNALSEAKSIRGIYETLYAKSDNGTWVSITTTASPSEIDDGVNKNSFPGIITSPETGTKQDGSFIYVEDNGWTAKCHVDGTIDVIKTTP